MEKSKGNSERRERLLREFARNAAEYRSCCQEVPSWMMVFPSKRRYCQYAREALYKSIADLYSNDRESMNEFSSIIYELE